MHELQCDPLLTPHPGGSGWECKTKAVQSRQTSCRIYADAAEKKLEEQLAAEREKAAG